MSAQINLFHPRFLKQRDLLTLGNVALAVIALYGVFAVAGIWAWNDAATQRKAATAAETQLREAKRDLEAVSKAAATRKPSPQLTTELENAEALLRRRGEIARLLEGGAVGSAGGFADYLRGLARQIPENLWLTGFTIGSGGNEMEIRGSTLNAAALPEYIRRLGTEKVFQGRNFAALNMNRSDLPQAGRSVAQGAAVAPASTLAARQIDFVLMPKLVEPKGSGS
ncbi:MAG: PilN domain-containing protein [Sulfuritalea sp.]|nr:PilN domain-containing protein [Sulfuritalea sp.]